MNTSLIIALSVILVLYFFISRRKSSVENISVEDLKKIDLTTISLIDVRTLKEVQGGTIGKPQHIELTAHFHKSIHDLDKDKDYIVYCRSGRRSQLAANIMASSGFKSVRNLAGGIQAWKAH